MTIGEAKSLTDSLTIEEARSLVDSLTAEERIVLNELLTHIIASRPENQKGVTV